MNKLLYVFLLLLAFYGCKESKNYQYDLSRIKSPIVFAGDSVTAYRGPAILFHDNRFYLFFTKTEIVGDSIFTFAAQSESSDLLNWSEPRRISPLDREKSFCGPGNVVRVRDQWIMCLHSYPRPGYVVSEMPRYANSTARIYIMRSKDLSTWSAPELLKLKGPDISEENMGRMLDPYIVQDKDDHNKWWCFYKQRGVGMSYTYDFENWIPYGTTRVSERVCVLTENNEYILFNSPRNGIAIKKSRTLQNWANWGNLITLGQEKWEWAKGRITAGTVINLKHIDGINAYVMFFHGSGPLTEGEGDFDKNSSIGIAWSTDLIKWSYPE